MNAIRRNTKKGFTLVEILIVVIILGILAAIVIPQFTNASTDARKNSLSSQLQTMRSQFELYKLQHNDKLPLAFASATGVVTDWTGMTGQTDVSGATTGTDFGPYLQQTPSNPLNGFTNMSVGTTDPALVGGGAAGCGFLMNRTTGKVWATSTKCANVYDEANPSNSANDD